MRCSCWQTTPNRSHFRTVHEAEHLGANMMAQAGREEIVYSAEVLSENSSALLEVGSSPQTVVLRKHQQRFDPLCGGDRSSPRL